MSSTGAVRVPLVNEFCWHLGTCEFLHETAFYILPPNFDLTLRWGPEKDDKVYLIFALTFGTPRNYITNEPVLSDEIGFWHRGKGMLLHWDPLVESILNIAYPHITPATKENPFEIRFVNRKDFPVIMDVSVWFFQYHRENYQKFLEFCEGFVNFFRAFARRPPVPPFELELRKPAEEAEKEEK